MNEQQPKTNAGQNIGIAALVIGIIALILAVIPCTAIFSLILGIIGIVLAIIGLTQAIQGNGKKGLVIAALVVSILGTAGAVIWGFVISKEIKNQPWIQDFEFPDIEEVDETETFEEELEEMEKVMEELEPGIQDSVVKDDSLKNDTVKE
jgi:phosphate/sulfate permease